LIFIDQKYKKEDEIEIREKGKKKKVKRVYIFDEEIKFCQFNNLFGFSCLILLIDI
jgi:hypothetical protein